MENAPVILLLPGTCCHWKGNFGHVIPMLAESFRVLCVSYDGFDETETTEFPTMIGETEKIEAYIRENCGGHIRAAPSWGCWPRGGIFTWIMAFPAAPTWIRRPFLQQSCKQICCFP